jgi:hypothetical protein
MNRPLVHAESAHPLAALEQAVAGNRRRIGSALRTFLDAPAPVRKAVHPAAADPLHLNFDGSTDRASSRADGYGRQIRQLRELQAHPGVLVRRFESSAGPLTAAAPAVSTAMQRKAKTAVDFLLSKAPPQPETWAGERAQPPSDAELGRWGRYVNALQHPLAALDGLAQGRVPAEATEAVRTVYPALYGEMQRQIARALIAHRTGGSTLSVPQRHALARFLGAPVDRITAPDFGQALQRTYAQERAQDPQPPRPTPPQAGRGGRKLITYQTPTQRLENR